MKTTWNSSSIIQSWYACILNITHSIRPHLFTRTCKSIRHPTLISHTARFCKEDIPIPAPDYNLTATSILFQQAKDTHALLFALHNDFSEGPAAITSDNTEHSMPLSTILLILWTNALTTCHQLLGNFFHLHHSCLGHKGFHNLQKWAAKGSNGIPSDIATCPIPMWHACQYAMPVNTVPPRSIPMRQTTLALWLALPRDLAILSAWIRWSQEVLASFHLIVVTLLHDDINQSQCGLIISHVICMLIAMNKQQSSPP